MAGFLFDGQGFKSYTYPVDVDSIKTMAVAMVNTNWIGNPLTNNGKYGLLYSIGVPFEGAFNGMCIHLLISAVTSANQTLVRTCWNGTWSSWVSLV